MDGAIRKLIAQLDERRRGSRSDVARELSLAITHLEDAAYRVQLADVREPRHPGDAVSAAAQHVPVVVGVPAEDETAKQEA